MGSDDVGFTEFRDMEDFLGSTEDEITNVESSAMDPEFPFWRLPKKEFQTILKIVKEIASRNADQVSKSIMLKYDGMGQVRYFVTNKDIYFSGVIQLKNESNVFDGEVVLSSKQLDDIAKFSADVVLYKEGDQFKASFMRGVQPLDVYQFSSDIYTQAKVPTLSKGHVTIDNITLKNQMEMYYNLMALASVAEDRRIIDRKSVV